MKQNDLICLLNILEIFHDVTGAFPNGLQCLKLCSQELQISMNLEFNCNNRPFMLVFKMTVECVMAFMQ